jgi:hypothetical protein
MPGLIGVENLDAVDKSAPMHTVSSSSMELQLGWNAFNREFTLKGPSFKFMVPLSAHYVLAPGESGQNF